MLQRAGGSVGERPVPIIHVENVVRQSVVGDVDVRPAVPVDVRYDHAEPVTGVFEDTRFFRHVRECAVAIIPIQLVVAARRRAAHARGMARDTTREILGRIVEQKQIEAAVSVIVEKCRLRREVGVGDAELCGGLGERPVAVVDEQQICPICRFRPLGPGDGYVDVEKPVVVDVDHRDARRPPIRLDARSLGDVLEAKVTLVPIEATRDHVAGEENVRQSVVIDVADGDARAVIHIDVGLQIQRISRRDRVREGDARLVGGQKSEQWPLPLARTAGEQDKN